MLGTMTEGSSMRDHLSEASNSSRRWRKTWFVSAALCLLVLSGLLSSAVYGDDSAPVKRQRLWRLEQEFRAMHVADRQAAVGYAQKHGLPLRRKLDDGSVIQLVAVRNNLPVYIGTTNINAADTVGADELWPGGSTPYGLTGSGILLGIWDAGPVRSTHQEFGGRVTLRDGSLYSGFHATHVGGTMVAAVPAAIPAVVFKKSRRLALVLLIRMFLLLGIGGKVWRGEPPGFAPHNKALI